MKLSDRPLLLEELKSKLKGNLPNKEAMAMMFPNLASMPIIVPDDAKPSAVMILLFHKNEEWHIIAIRRTEDGHAHSGQISFPGGKKEQADENLLITALRETYEEIGIRQENIEYIGSLSSVYISVSNFNVYPYIGFLKNINELNISTDEVQEVLEIKLSELLSPHAKITTEVKSPIQPKLTRVVNAYKPREDVIIWGATALMIAELELILR